MSNSGPKHNRDRRQFLKIASGTMGLRLLGLTLPPGATILSGCTKTRTPEMLAKRLVIAIDERVQTFDPALQTRALDSFVITNIYDPLTWHNKDLELVPRLATEWNSPDDGITWDFKIRPGVLFHDGGICDANAVKYHFDRIMDPETHSKRRSKMLKVQGLEVVDPLTVRFNMKEPFSIWPVVMRDAFAGPVSQAAVLKYGNEKFTEHPVGTGPYMVQEQAGDRVLLKKNPAYWRADEFPVEEVELRTIWEPTTRLIMLEQKSIDLASITFAHTEVAQKSENVEIISSPYLQVRYVGINNMKPPFNDPRVRRAANMAINRAELVKYAFRNNADPLVGPLPSIMREFNKTMKTWDYDLKTAKALMAEAGYEKGVDVVLWSKDDVSDTNLGIVVADQLRHIGIRVEIVRFDRNVYWDKFDPYQTLDMQWFPTKPGVFDLFAAGWVGGESPHGYLDPLFRSTSTSNSTFYKNPEIDQLLADSLRIVDNDQRDEVYRKIQEVIVQDAPWIFCYCSRIIWGINPRVSGLHQHPAGEYELDGIQLGGGTGLA